MGKVKPRILGDEEVEKKQKEEAKKKSAEKKMAKKTEEKTVGEVKIKPAKKAVIKEAKFVQTKTKGKKYQAVAKLVDKKKSYAMAEAVALLKKLKTAKFDESVELHLNVSETGLKGEVELPHATGKTVRIAVVNDAVLTEIEKGKINFDVLITHPSFMPRLARFAKVLGPKGLMPNPKAGTISPNPEEVVKKFEKGVLRWKTEPKFPLIHQMIGKMSYEEKDLSENADKFIQAVGPGKITKAVIKSTMSPGINILIVKE